MNTTALDLVLMCFVLWKWDQLGSIVNSVASLLTKKDNPIVSSDDVEQGW